MTAEAEGLWPALTLPVSRLQRLGLALAGGAATALAFAPAHLSPVLYLTLPMLFVLLEDGNAPVGRQRLLRAFGAAWTFGLGFHLVGLHWVGNAFLVQADVFAWALPFAVTLLPAGLSIFFGLAGIVVALTPARGLWRPVVFVLALTAAEWLRSVILTGFPWNVIGYALAWPLELMQAIAYVGLHGLTLLALTLALVPFLVWRWAQRRGLPAISVSVLAVASAVVPLIGLYAGGSARLAAIETTTLPDVRLRLVQPSINQTNKWQPQKQAEIFHKHLDLTADGDERTPPLAGAGVTHILWAEAAMPFRPLESDYAKGRLADLVPSDTLLIAGVLRSEPRTLPPNQTASGLAAIDVYNSAAVLDADAKVVALYDKFHLVPFGEYLPLPGVFEAIGFETLVRERGGFTAASGQRGVMSIPGLPPVEMLICYEAIFPHEIARGPTRPGLMINLTNDGWFGKLSGPYQHLLQTQARAVEQGIPLVRVSNNGVSAIIDPVGRIHGPLLGLNDVAVADVTVPVALQPTVYARWRDVPALLIAIVLFGVAILSDLRSRLRLRSPA